MTICKILPFDGNAMVFINPDIRNFNKTPKDEPAFLTII
jgi:hypothetical protein